MKINEVDETVAGAIGGFAKPFMKMRRRNKTESLYDMNKDDPNNPEVLIQGYGRMSMTGLKNMLTKELAELNKFADSGDWERIHYEMDRGTFMPKLNALVQAMEDLENVRKKGGSRSRGIEKR